MADFTLSIQVGFTQETLMALGRLFAVAGQPPSPAPSLPARPVAPGDSAPQSVALLLEPAEGPGCAAGETENTRRPPKAPRVLLPKKPQSELQAAANRANLAKGRAAKKAKYEAALAAAANPAASHAPDPADIRPNLASVWAAPAAAMPEPPQPPPRESRIDIMRRVAASIPAKPAVQPRGEPIVAGQEAIRGWAAQRGLDMREFDLAAVNARAASIGHPGFILKTRRA